MRAVWIVGSVASMLFLIWIGGAGSAGQAARLTETPTPTLPPPVTAPAITGYICSRAGDFGVCWPTARFTLSYGPGPVCGRDMSIMYYLTSEAVSLSVYEAELVVVHGLRETAPDCEPLLHVADVTLPPRYPLYLPALRRAALR